MQEHNDQFRATLSQGTGTGTDAEELAALEEQYREALAKHRAKRREVRDLQQELSALSDSLESLRREEEESENRTAALLREHTTVGREMRELQQRLGRLDEQVQTLRREVRRLHCRSIVSMTCSLPFTCCSRLSPLSLSLSLALLVANGAQSGSKH